MIGVKGKGEGDTAALFSADQTVKGARMDFVKITRLKASCMTLAMGVAAVQTCAAGSGENKSVPFFSPFSLASAAGRFGVDTRDEIVDIAAAGVGMQDLPLMATRTIGICQLIENPPIPALTAANVAAPAMAAWSYLTSVEKIKLSEDMSETAKTTLLEGAKHGELKEEWGGNYRYHPTPGYFGTDRATVLVEMGNYKVKVIIHIKVLPRSEIGGRMYGDKNNCPKGELWKISLNPDAPSAPTYSFTTVAA